MKLCTRLLLPQGTLRHVRRLPCLRVRWRRYYSGRREASELSEEFKARFTESIHGWGRFQPRSARDALKVAVRRIAGSFGRTDRMQTQGRILDYAIALDILYQLDRSELTYKLGTRAASLPGNSTGGRVAPLKRIAGFDDTRSEIVRGQRKRGHRKLRQEELRARRRGWSRSRLRDPVGDTPTWPLSRLEPIGPGRADHACEAPPKRQRRVAEFAPVRWQAFLNGMAMSVMDARPLTAARHGEAGTPPTQRDERA